MASMACRLSARDGGHEGHLDGITGRPPAHPDACSLGALGHQVDAVDGFLRARADLAQGLGRVHAELLEAGRQDLLVGLGQLLARLMMPLPCRLFEIDPQRPDFTVLNLPRACRQASPTCLAVSCPLAASSCSACT